MRAQPSQVSPPFASRYQPRDVARASTKTVLNLSPGCTHHGLSKGRLKFLFQGLLTRASCAYSLSISSAEGRLSGRHAEDGTRRRRPRADLSIRAREALGCPSAPTTRGCLQWLDGRRRRRTKARQMGAPKRAPGRRPEARVQGQKSPRVERPGGAFSGSQRRRRRLRTVSRAAFTPAAQGSDRKGPAFPGAPLPSPFPREQLRNGGLAP